MAMMVRTDPQGPRRNHLRNVDPSETATEQALATAQ